MLLDLRMPELDGMGVLAAMQENARFRGIPVMVLTAQVNSHTRDGGLDRKRGGRPGERAVHCRRNAGAYQTSLGGTNGWGPNHNTLSQIKVFIQEHYAEQISREEMASNVGVSARHLTRCFHQETGISLITYLNRYRVKQAKHLLQAGDRNITEVAEAVGFSSSNYFTDAFRRETGMSPRDYQKTLRLHSHSASPAA